MVCEWYVSGSQWGMSVVFGYGGSICQWYVSGMPVVFGYGIEWYASGVPVV